MAREKKKIPNYIVKEFGEHPRIFSYSNISSIGGDNCSWEYYLSRIKKLEGIDGIYGILGGLGHKQLEDFYSGKISYSDMVTEFEKEYLVIESGEYKFHSDETINAKRSAEYKANLVHFFKNHKVIKGKVLTEVEFWVGIEGVFKDHLFMGFIDAIHKEKETGDYIITDWKTSSYGAEYKGDRLISKSHQLLLYAYAIHKLKKIPYDKIKVRWCFMKYCTVDIDYVIKSKKEIQHKQYIAERIKWVDKVKSQLKKDIEKYYPDLMEMEKDIMLEQCISSNDLSILCDEIRNNYVLNDFYLYADLTEDTIEELVDYIENQVHQLDKLGTKEGDAENWHRDKPISYINELGKTKDDSFYCSTLCGQRKNCHYYKEFLDDLKTAEQRIIDKDEEDLLAELDDLI